MIERNGTHAHTHVHKQTHMLIYTLHSDKCVHTYKCVLSMHYTHTHRGKERQKH